MDETGVANLALGHLGISKAIASLSERSVEAINCARFFVQCRQEVLRSFPWGFALCAEPLALVAGQTFPGWGYVYQAPAGNLRIRAVADEGGLRIIRDSYLYQDSSSMELARIVRVPYQIALKADRASQVILCDLQNAWAFFTADVENIGAWAVDAVTVFGWHLAATAGGSLNAKAEKIERAELKYAQWHSWAAANNLNEQRDDQRAESPSISCRA